MYCSDHIQQADPSHVTHKYQPSHNVVLKLSLLTWPNKYLYASHYNVWNASFKLIYFPPQNHSAPFLIKFLSGFTISDGWGRILLICWASPNRNWTNAIAGIVDIYKTALTLARSTKCPWPVAECTWKQVLAFQETHWYFLSWSWTVSPSFPPKPTAVKSREMSNSEVLLTFFPFENFYFCHRANPNAIFVLRQEGKFLHEPRSQS